MGAPALILRGTQMNDYLHLPIGKESPEIVTTVIEIPKDSSNKYEYDKQLQVFRLDRNLYSPVQYPADYGFIPQTLAEDGPWTFLFSDKLRHFPAVSFMRGRSVYLKCWIREFMTKRFWRMQPEIRATPESRATKKFLLTSCARFRTSFPSTRISRGNTLRPLDGRIAAQLIR